MDSKRDVLRIPVSPLEREFIAATLSLSNNLAMSLEKGVRLDDAALHRESEKLDDLSHEQIKRMAIDMEKNTYRQPVIVDYVAALM